MSNINIVLLLDSTIVGLVVFKSVNFYYSYSKMLFLWRSEHFLLVVVYLKTKDISSILTQGHKLKCKAGTLWGGSFHLFSIK